MNDPLAGTECGRFVRIAERCAVAISNLWPAPAGNGGDRIRTDDPLLAKQMLSQLSYTPDRDLRRGQGRSQQRVWAREDLNLRPHAYQACALTS